ncbi:hypothetical protein SAMN05421736_10548 [Evansella caseinilytica]|uniref:Uncharacterized protein n=1 Tax=Evansella caseinilytica TaxID=1503961 RepID=A0A1H3PGW2_9BACI|nr:hypothetical protein [Evansella caseinilytica]SDZ00402.1 hypothetical protein SAMN05421736_10548 [Evansella caseinilytica]
MIIIVIINILVIIACFVLLIMSLLNLFPKWIAFPLLLLSILFFVHLLNERRRFKGFNSANRV